MMRVIKALLGIALIMVGPMLIVITVDDTVFLKNILLRIIGGLFILLGVHLLHRQFHPNSYTSKPTSSE
ncbi:hypothetical protein NY607_00655 [Lysinibacillus sp. A4]|uniref:hypothetical protein n=1 Tax=unclassified Lysinibacillus TaxID=2636778 RepID=UPI00103C9917|nr:MULTISPECIES: hypothetical protein [unclassified Lysinibacillus]MCS5499610.1 hypothetical protein [Lysinibacillus sp. A4]TBV90151.1 hypothetical protein EW028_04265 [Lysinibacillus sp. OL1]WGT41486.1 hypothetical protein QH639_12110 [Lysinibacillus sp. 1 U-2021]